LNKKVAAPDLENRD